MFRELELVREWHSKFNVPLRDTAAREQVPSAEREMRATLVIEETEEVIEAITEDDVEHIAKELADLLYVTAGSAAQTGELPTEQDERTVIIEALKSAAAAFAGSSRWMAENGWHEETSTHMRQSMALLEVLVLGVAAKYNIPIDAVFDEVHASNMSKLWDDGKPRYREDGKVLKPPHYRTPNIGPLLY